MRVGVLGTGMVGRALAGRLVDLGHEVMMGSREAGNLSAATWANQAGAAAKEGSFSDAASFGEIVVNAVKGAASLDALRSAGAGNLSGKILMDVSNPLDPSSGMPPVLTVCNTDSMGEQIQRAFPDALVVKTLNTVNADVMVNPGIVPGHHVVFVSGNSEDAKRRVAELLTTFGWPVADVVDLGDITSARGAEMYLPLWLRLFQTSGSPRFNIELRRR